MKALIIDDEAKARSLLSLIVQENCPQISEINVAADLPEGVRMIRECQPDIVFLDIEMPGYSGLQLLDFFTPDQINFEILFTTAYSEYALQSFRLSAIDYLLKPLCEEQVVEAVAKAIEVRGRSQISERLKELKHTLEAHKVRKIGIPVANGILFVKFDDIILMEADRMYTYLYTTQNEKLLVSKPLKFFSDVLKGASEFYKPHRSYLINLRHLKQYVMTDGGYIIMDNEKTVSISKEKKDEFLELMQSV